jgi:ribosomal protein S18 acetylase RimI-like enzyme
MSLSFTIQNANWRDLSTLRQLEGVCFEKDAWPMLDLIAALTFPDVIHLKAIVGDKMVGFVGGDVKRSEGIGWVTTLAVLPGYRRQGIASALLRECEQALLAQAIQFIRLCVRRDNDEAIRLYQRYGYRQIGTWPSYYQDGQDALVFEKQGSGKRTGF